jgi:hypothetical protein
MVLSAHHPLPSSGQAPVCNTVVCIHVATHRRWAVGRSLSIGSIHPAYTGVWFDLALAAQTCQDHPSRRLLILLQTLSPFPTCVSSHEATRQSRTRRLNLFPCARRCSSNKPVSTASQSSRRQVVHWNSARSDVSLFQFGVLVDPLDVVCEESPIFATGQPPPLPSERSSVVLTSRE